MEIRQTLHDETVQAGLREGPRFVIARVQAAMLARAQRIAATAKQLAPKLFSTLANSIIVEQVGELHYRVRTGVNYARAAEEGTGPAAGRQSYMPNREALLQYLTHSPAMRRFSWARKGSARRRDQVRELRDRSWALALWIRRHGTKAKPYMKPALDLHREAFYSDVRIAALVGAREAFSAQLVALRGGHA